ncbi:MAG: hypothetical protein N4A38_00215 [Candidatus Gracilibacteria bacterium]|nr:hypothetical protein [Candidatus Gracilibacteria bacterium]
MLHKYVSEYIDKYGLKKLHNETGITKVILLDIAKNKKNKKYFTNTLNILYDFFKLKKGDEFYRQNFKKWNPKTPSLFGNLIRTKRLQKFMSLDDLSRAIKADKRGLARIEAGDSLPSENSWNIKHIFLCLDFTPEEQELTKNYISTMKKLNETVKQYEEVF